MIFKSAKHLTKEYLTGIFAGWQSILKKNFNNYEEAYGYLTSLDSFINNFKEQLIYVHRSPIFDPIPVEEYEIKYYNKYLNEEQILFIQNKKFEIYLKFEKIDKIIKNNLSITKSLKNLINNPEISEKRKKITLEDFINFKSNIEEELKLVTNIFKTIISILKISTDLINEKLQDFYKQETDYKYNLFGMNVILTYHSGKYLNADEANKYIEIIKQAYFKIKSKNLEKLWYGNIFIDVVAGGKNAGTYRDDDSIYLEIEPYNEMEMIETIVHELGHRYFFRFMSESDRLRFESMIKQLSKSKRYDFKNDPVEHINEIDVKIINNNYVNYFDKTLISLNKIIDDYINSINGNELKNKFIKPSNLINNIKNIIYDFDNSIEYKDLSRKDKKIILNHSSKYLEREYVLNIFNDLKNNFSIEKLQLLKEEFKKWIQALFSIVFAYESKPKPVSDYGYTDQWETYAEAFTWYVLGRPMTRDQLQSFKEVSKISQTNKYNSIYKLSCKFEKACKLL